jgi:hypothetical protein
MAPRKYTIEDMKKKARDLGGQCLSKKYKNIEQKLKWKCKKGHIFKSFAHNVYYHDKWCAICGIEKRAKAQANSIEDCHQLAKEKGGKCLSKVYKNVGQQLRWECKEGHRWYTPYRQVKGSKKRGGTWCPKCNGRNPKNITFARDLGKSLGIQCLSSEYVNYNSKLKWKCKNGHEFEQPLAKLAAKRRCPRCHIYYGEEICRNYLEAIFGRKFPKAKPDFLKLEKGIFLELDGYNEEIKLAFEHHGLQHYQYNSRFYNKIKDFKKRLEFDKYKKDKCLENDVKLLVIPSIPEKLRIEDVSAFLISELQKQKVSFDLNKVPESVKIVSPSINKTIERLKELAVNRGGKLLSKTYYASGEKLKWKCEAGHVWEASAENVIGSKSKKGTWCPKCAESKRSKSQRDTIEHMQEIAKSRGGVCISEKYINAQTNIEWECSKKHRWFASQNSVTSQNSWCPYCAGKKVNLETINAFVKDFHGQCVSKKYVDNLSPLKWSCKKKHIFELPLRWTSLEKCLQD